MIPSRPFCTPAIIHFGEEAAANAGPEAKRLGARKVLLLIDKVLAEVGAIDPVVTSLVDSGVKVLFNGVNSKGDLSHVDTGLQMLKEEKCDFLVACGGYRSFPKPRTTPRFCVTQLSTGLPVGL
ncbi:MAG: iron-containing alcohol dehydrogenase [Pedobacter sp.]|jgi:alcohol dehydrogenase class IV